MSIYEYICNPQNYLNLLKEKYAYFKNDVNFVEYFYPLLGHEERINLIVNSLATGTYKLSHVKPAWKNVNGKKRLIYYLLPQDRIVLAVLQKAIRKLLYPEEIKHVFNNHVGRSPLEAVHLLNSFIKSKHNNKKMDLYILRSDWKDFTDNIPVHENSPIWQQFKSICERDTSQKNMGIIWELIKDGIRPQVLDGNDLKQLDIGVPTGSPFTAIVSIIYPLIIDSNFKSFKGSFYLRYADDLIFAHSNPDIVLKAYANFQELSNDLHLVINHKKLKLLYLTCCGRPPEKKYNQFKGTSKLEYLGCLIYSSGAIRASNKDKKKFMHHLKRRLETVRILTKDKSFEERLAFLVDALKLIIKPLHPLAENKLSSLLYKISDRQQLKAIDQEIMMAIIQKATNIKGKKALRVLSFRELLDRHKLNLLEKTKNIESS